MPKPPDRWLDYKNIGKQIPGSCFVPIKVPLKNNFLENLEDSEKFSCEDVIKLISDAKMTIGLIIDLTYTKKYYDPVFFTKQGIKYQKIFVPGHIIPPSSVVSQFTDCVNNFLDNNKTKSSVILVHCTHGLNRTGYMICRYLIEEKNFDPDNAIKLFNEARGHNMERQNYVNHLKTLKSYEKSQCANKGEQGVTKNASKQMVQASGFRPPKNNSFLSENKSTLHSNYYNNDYYNNQNQWYNRNEYYYPPSSNGNYYTVQDQRYSGRDYYKPPYMRSTRPYDQQAAYSTNYDYPSQSYPQSYYNEDSWANGSNQFYGDTNSYRPRQNFSHRRDSSPYKRNTQWKR